MFFCPPWAAVLVSTQLDRGKTDDVLFKVIMAIHGNHNLSRLSGGPVFCMSGASQGDNGVVWLCVTAESQQKHTKSPLGGCDKSDLTTCRYVHDEKGVPVMIRSKKCSEPNLASTKLGVREQGKRKHGETRWSKA